MDFERYLQSAEENMPTGMLPFTRTHILVRLEGDDSVSDLGVDFSLQDINIFYVFDTEYVRQ